MSQDTKTSPRRICREGEKSDSTFTTIQVTKGLMARFQIAQSAHHVATGDKLTLPKFLAALLDMFDEREV